MPELCGNTPITVVREIWHRNRDVWHALDDRCIEVCLENASNDWFRDVLRYELARRLRLEVLFT